MLRRKHMRFLRIAAFFIFSLFAVDLWAEQCEIRAAESSEGDLVCT